MSRRAAKREPRHCPLGKRFISTSREVLTHARGTGSPVRYVAPAPGAPNRKPRND